MNNPIAIITGASTGIGKSLSLELSKRNFEIILVSRNKEKLSIVNKRLKIKVEDVPL